ncbi:MAG: hypothetical protein WDO19_13885 [Bacteroidota bacterium]
MNIKPGWFILTSAFYFNCWMVLIVIYQLSGWGRIAGAFVTLWTFTVILTSLRLNSRYSLY